MRSPCILFPICSETDALFRMTVVIMNGAEDVVVRNGLAIPSLAAVGKERIVLQLSRHLFVASESSSGRKDVHVMVFVDVFDGKTR